MSLRALRIVAVGVALTACLALALGACGGAAGDGRTDTLTDPYEPNDDFMSATVLTPGVALHAFIDKPGQSGDWDVFSCYMPLPDGSEAFKVEIRSFQAGDLDVQMAIMLPDAFEGITYPGWSPRLEGTTIVFEGSASEGNLLVFVNATRAAAYSIRLTSVE